MYACKFEEPVPVKSLEFEVTEVDLYPSSSRLCPSTVPIGGLKSWPVNRWRAEDLSLQLLEGLRQPPQPKGLHQQLTKEEYTSV